MRDDLIYYVDEAKRTIACVATECEYDLITELIKEFNDSKKEDKFLLANLLSMYEEELMLDYKYIGKAYCDINDEFDVEIGRTIARQKMREKYNKAKANRMERFCETIQKILSGSINKMNFYRNNENKYNNLVNEYREEN